MSENPTKLDMDTLSAYAGEMNMNLEAFRTCVESRKYTKAIEDDVAVAKSIGVSGTPAFVIGRSTPEGVDGQLLLGALPYKIFEQRLNSLLQ